MTTRASSQHCYSTSVFGKDGFLPMQKISLKHKNAASRTLSAKAPRNFTIRLTRRLTLCLTPA